ncbi:MAG: hypothetical protein ACLFSQ_08555 [Candidatus Zixiibacteriota bacterium]
MNGQIPIGDTISYSWNLVKANIGQLILIMFIALVIMFIPLILAGLTVQNSELLSTVFSFAFWGLQVIIILGFIRIGLKIHRSEDISIGDLFSVTDKLLSYLIAALLYSIIVGIGTLFFIIPGIYLGIRFGMFPILIVDENLGPIEAFQRSSEMTQGNILNLFLLMIVLNLINVIGSIPFGLGLFITMPLALVAYIHAYSLLSGEVSSSNSMGFGAGLPRSNTIGFKQDTKKKQPNVYDGPSGGPSYLNQPSEKKTEQNQNRNRFSYSDDAFQKSTTSQEPNQEPDEMPDLSDMLIEETLTAQEYTKKAMENFKKKNYQSAIADYSKALEMDRNNKMLWYSRANSKIKAGDLMGAVDDFTEAINIDPNFAKAYLNRGAVKRKIGANKGAKEDIKKAITIDPALTKYFKKS